MIAGEREVGSGLVTVLRPRVRRLHGQYLCPAPRGRGGDPGKDIPEIEPACEQGKNAQREGTFGPRRGIGSVDHLSCHLGARLMFGRGTLRHIHPVHVYPSPVPLGDHAPRSGRPTRQALVRPITSATIRLLVSEVSTTEDSRSFT